MAKTMDEMRRELINKTFKAKYGMMSGEDRREPFFYGHAYRELIEPFGLVGRERKWRSRVSNEVESFVTGFEHHFLSTVTPDMVELAINRSTHALGTLDREKDVDLFIAKANPPWAMIYLFHMFMEEHGAVPTWDQFLAFVKGPAARLWWWPVKASASKRYLNHDYAERAMTWRIATSWQSAIRTVYAISVIRHRHDVPIRYHLFAHVELKLDGWLGQHAIRLVMSSEYEGRKTSPHKIFASTPLEIHDVSIKRQGRGAVWLPDDRSLADTAKAFTKPPRQKVGPGTLSLFGED